jgi:hypothetical protein
VVVLSVRWVEVREWIWVSAGSRLACDIGLLILSAGDLRDKIDDRSPNLCIGNPHEGFGELDSIRRSEIVIYILRRRSLGRCVGAAPHVWSFFEEELDPHP